MKTMRILGVGRLRLIRQVFLSLLVGSVVGTGCVTHEPVRRPGPAPMPRSQPPRPPAQVQPGPGPARPLVRRPAGDPRWFPSTGKISPRWTTIVIHHSATPRGSAQSFDKAHRDKGWEGLGYHFVIGNGSGSGDGAVEVGTRWHSQKHGAHCKTPNNYFNEHGVGICLVGDFTKTRPTPRQMESLQRLVGFLSFYCGIPPSKVTTHGAVTNKTICPGPNFPLAAVRRSMATGATATSLP